MSVDRSCDLLVARLGCRILLKSRRACGSNATLPRANELKMLMGPSWENTGGEGPRGAQGTTHLNGMVATSNYDSCPLAIESAVPRWWSPRAVCGWLLLWGWRVAMITSRVAPFALSRRQPADPEGLGLKIATATGSGLPPDVGRLLIEIVHDPSLVAEPARSGL